MSRIVITGMGVITALGFSVDENEKALKNAASGLSTLDFLRTNYFNASRFGEIKIEVAALKNKLGVNRNGVTRTDLLALHACADAIKNSGLSDSEITSYDTAFINGGTVGGICLTDDLYRDANNTSANASEYISAYDASSPAFFLQQLYGFKGITNSFNTACSSSANAIMYGARLIKNGFAKRAIVGGADSLAKFTINGFNSLGILAPQLCKPYDKDRNGLNLGEGAGYIVLEREEDVKHKKQYAQITGYANANDAFHPSSLSPEGEGPYRAMSGAMKVAGLKPEEIDFINTHGTGTENNDEVESNAMKRIFDNVPFFISSKSKIGHTLGAAAVVEAIFSIVALNNNEIYPSMNFTNAIESTGLRPVIALTKHPMHHIMTNSFAFGGNCSSLIFSKA